MLYDEKWVIFPTVHKGVGWIKRNPRDDVMGTSFNSCPKIPSCSPSTDLFIVMTDASAYILIHGLCRHGAVKVKIDLGYSEKVNRLSNQMNFYRRNSQRLKVLTRHTGWNSKLCRLSFFLISTACFKIWIWKFAQICSYPMTWLKHETLTQLQSQ